MYRKKGLGVEPPGSVQGRNVTHTEAGYGTQRLKGGSMLYLWIAREAEDRDSSWYTCLIERGSPAWEKNGELSALK